MTYKKFKYLEELHVQVNDMSTAKKDTSQKIDTPGPTRSAAVATQVCGLLVGS